MINKLIAQRYMIGTKLGEGLLGNTFICVDRAIKKEVTIKIVSSPLIDKSNIFNNFYQNFRKLLDIDHENILSPIDSGLTTYEGEDGNTTENSVPFMIFDYFKGKQLLPGLHSFQLNEALSLFRKLLTTVNVYHEKNIIHRAIKPGNVIVDSDNNLRVTHFGLYPLTDYKPGSSYADMLSTIYRAPELTDGEDGDITSDYYSLGALLYQMLSGSFPFSGQNIDEILNAQHNNQILSLCKINPDVNLKLENVVSRLLDSKPENRFFSIDEIRSALDELFITIKAVDLPEAVSKEKNTKVKKSEQVLKRGEIEKNIKNCLSAKSKQKFSILSAPSGSGKTTTITSILRQYEKKGQTIITHNCCPIAERSFLTITKLCSSIIKQKELNEEEIPAVPWMISILMGKRNFRTIESEICHLFDEEQNNLKQELISFLDKIIDSSIFLIIENIQWVDKGSLEIISEYLQYSTNNYLSILATHDSEYQISNMPESIDFNLYNLPALTAEETEELIKKTASCKEVPKEISDALWEKSSGNIMYIGESIKYLIKHGKVSIDKKTLNANKTDILKLPDSLRDLLNKKLYELTEKLQIIYKTASCIGLSFDLRTLCDAITNMPDTLIQDLLTNFKNMEIHRQDAESDNFYFTSPLYQQIFYSSSSDREHSVIHGKIADLLEKDSINNPHLKAETLYLHFSKSEKNSEAIKYLLKMAEKNTIFRLYSVASRQYEKIIEAIEGQSNMVRELWNCLHKLALIKIRINEKKQTEKYLKMAAEIAENNHDVVAFQECVFYLADIYLSNDDSEAAEKIITKALNKETLRDSIWKSKLLSKRAFIATINSYRNISFDDAISDIKNALYIARELRDIQEIIEMTEFMADMYISQHKETQAEIFLCNTLNFRISTSKRLEILEKLSKLFLYPGNNMQKVREYAEKGLSTAYDYASFQTSALFSLIIAQACINLGEIKQADQMINSVYIDNLEPELLMLKSIINAELEIKRGNPQLALEELKTSEKLTHKVKDNELITDFYIIKGVAQKYVSPAAAIRTYDTAIERAEKNNYIKGQLLAIAGQIDSYRVTKDYDKAEQNIHKALMIKKQSQNSFVDNIMIMTQAMIHRSKRNSQLALELLESASKNFKKAGNVFEEGIASYEKAKILKQIKMDYKEEAENARRCFNKFENSVILEEMKNDGL